MMTDVVYLLMGPTPMRGTISTVSFINSISRQEASAAASAGDAYRPRSFERADGPVLATVPSLALMRACMRSISSMQEHYTAVVDAASTRASVINHWTFMAKFLDLFGFACMDQTQLYPKHDATKHDATNSMAPNRSTLSRWERGGPAHPFGVMTARPLILPPRSS